MAISETSIDLQVVDAKDSTLTLEELLSLSSNNSCAIFLTPHGVIMGGKVIADVANLEGFIPNSEASVNPTANSIVKRDGNGDIKVHGIVDDTGIMYALPYSSEEVKDNADAILQMEITDLDTIRSNAAKGATAVQKSGGTMTGPLTVPTVIGDLEGTSDFAKDLTGRIEATPEEFTFRPSAGDKSIRDESAVIRSIKGNSLVWNNSVNNADSTSFKSGNANGVISANGDVYTLTSVSGGSMYLFYRTNAFINSLIVGHSYILLADIKHNSASNMWLSIVGVSDDSSIKISQNNTWDSYGKVFTISNISSSTPFIRVLSGTTVSGEEVSIRKLRLVDLTKMFGSGNEPTTVEEFYERMPQGVDVNAYNEGEIIDGNYEAIETVGFNQWDEQWELGWLNASGVEETTSLQIRNKGYIPILPNTPYYFKAPYIRYFLYDESKTAIGGAKDSKSFTTPANAKYLRFSLNEGYGKIYKNDICINLAHTGVRNGEYEPYEKHLKDLSVIQKYFPNGMRSAGSIYDEIRYNEATEQWEAVQRVGVVDLGSLTWIYLSSAKNFVAIFNGLKRVTDYPYGDYVNAINSIGYKNNAYEMSVANDKEIAVNYNSETNNTIIIKDTSYTDGTTFKTAMSGVMLNYELAEPIITPIVEPIQLDYWVEDFGTEKLISTGGSTPFKADVIYQFNATDRIRDNYRNIALLSKSKLDNPNGTPAQFVKGDGSLDDNIYADVYTLTARSGSLSTEQFNELMTSKVVRMTANASEDGNSNLEIQAVTKVYNASTAVMSSMYYNGSQFKMAIITFTKSGTTWSYTTTLQNLGIAPAVVEV